MNKKDEETKKNYKCEEGIDNVRSPAYVEEVIVKKKSETEKTLEILLGVE